MISKVESHWKLFVVVGVMTIAIASVFSAFFSYATNGDSNQIYTRDELSEKINRLENNGDFIELNFSGINGVAGNFSHPLGVMYNTNENIFSYNQNTSVLTVLASGYYKIDSSVLAFFASANSYSAEVIFRKNGVQFNNLITTLEAVNTMSQMGSNNHLEWFDSGTTLVFTYNLTGNATLYGTYSIEYIGQKN